MRCPYCNHSETNVRDSRAAEDGAAVRRRRVCASCGARITTFERAQLRDMVVLKSGGRREAFSRDKLLTSARLALRKRRIGADETEQLVSGVVRQLESRGDDEIASRTIGDLMMQALKERDSVAYVRFASVYRDFTDVKDFARIIGDMAGEYPHEAIEAGEDPCGGSEQLQGKRHNNRAESG